MISSQIKFYYEIDTQEARLRFFNGNTLITDWNVKITQGIPVMFVPSSLLVTIAREDWFTILKYVDKWLTGLINADIILSESRELSRIRSEYKVDDVITFQHRLLDVNKNIFEMCNMEYSITSDEITINARNSGIIFWVDFLNYLKSLNYFKSFVKQIYKTTL